MMHRVMMRDYARRNRNYNRDYNRGSENRMRDERYGSTMDHAREQNDFHMLPQMYSNEYAMGGRAFDSNVRNKYTPRGFDSRESDYRYSNPASAESDYERGGDRAMRDRRMDGHYYYPFEVAGRFGKESYYPMYDYASGSPYLTEYELDEWSKRLLHSIDEKYKDTLKKEHIIKEAEEVGVHFDQFTKDEFYVTVLMMYTDYCKTLGTANFDVYLKLAKDWLVDDDIAVKGSEKLAVYHDKIVQGM